MYFLDVQEQAFILIFTITSDSDPDTAVDIESKDSHFLDTVHCIAADGDVWKIVQPVHLQLLNMMISLIWLHR